MRRSHFEKFEEHTLLKHFLVDHYIKQWAAILLGTQRGQGFPRVWFVDAFAGAGCDQEGRPGSPLIAAQIAVGINAQTFPDGITDATGMRVFAIEADDDRFKSLDEQLAEHTARRPQYCFTHHGVLADRLDRFREHVKNDPVLYFLDPFGIEGLEAELLPKLLEGPHNELLLLFSDEGAHRLFGKSRAQAPDAEDLFAQAEREERMQPSLLETEEDLNRRIGERRAAIQRCLAGHKSNPNARRILNAAYGGDYWEAELARVPKEERQVRSIELYEDLLRRSGATHVLRFSIDTPEGRHKYFMLHASKSASAFAAMKDAMHRTRRHREAKAGGAHSPSLISMIDPEFVAESDIGAIADQLAAHFAGQTVRWDEKGSPNTVQRWAIENTPLWKHERDALKSVLAARGWAVKIGQAQAYRFPARPG